MAISLTVTGKQIDVGDALRQHISDSLSAVVEKYFGDGIDAHAVVSREAYLYCIDLQVHIGRGILLQSKEKDADVHVAADRAIDHIAKRMRRYKRKLRDHHANGREHRAEKASYLVLATQPDAATDDQEDVVDDTSDQPLVVAETTTDIPTLTVGEAVMRLDLSNSTTLMFRNSKHGGFNVVYRRVDGHIGWIDPGEAVADAS